MPHLHPPTPTPAPAEGQGQAELSLLAGMTERLEGVLREQREGLTAENKYDHDHRYRKMKLAF